MKWTEVQPGDMIMVGGAAFKRSILETFSSEIDPNFFKLFEHDVFFVVGVQQNDKTFDKFIDVQLLTTSNAKATKKHRMYRNEISPVFSVFRNGEPLVF